MNINENNQHMTERRKNSALRLTALFAAMMIAAGILASCGGSGEAAGGSSDNAAVTSIAEFTTADMEGNEVTQDVFSKADITVLNFWGTYCPPCIQEMPDLQKMSEEFAEKYDGRAQVIGVMVDVDVSDTTGSSYEAAEKIISKQGVKFTNIQPTGSLLDYMSTLYGVPTTIFVDSSGNIVGEPVVGASIKAYKSAVEDYLADK